MMSMTRLEVGAAWRSALEQAQLGDVQPARDVRAHHANSAMDHYFYGRCLIVAGEGIDEALAVLESAESPRGENPLLPHVKALGYLRQGDDAAAVTFLQRARLPHDLDLLAATAIELERRLRPIKLDSPMLTRPWPPGLAPPEPVPESDNLSQPGVSSRNALAKPAGRRRLHAELESLFLKFDYTGVFDRVDAQLAQGREDAEMHLIAGLSAEEAGMLDRSRAHLARSLRLEPDHPMARMSLARAYLRAGWNEIALLVARSLPVEGPNDSGRFYLLGLIHDALGDRAASREAMNVALTDFFYDTRHFHIKRAYDRWLHGLGLSSSASKA